MEKDSQGVTPEQYMLETLKKQIGERYAAYEEALATLQTQLAMANQKIQGLETEESGDNDELVAEEEASA